MRDGFVKVGAATPDILVADCVHNREEIVKKVKEMAEAGTKVMAFPELCITGYTCSDLFWQELLLVRAKEELHKLEEELEEVEGLIIVGLPLEFNQKLYNTAAVISGGKVLGFVPKHHLPNYAEFYEARHFTAGCAFEGMVNWYGREVPF